MSPPGTSTLTTNDWGGPPTNDWDDRIAEAAIEPIGEISEDAKFYIACRLAQRHSWSEIEKVAFEAEMRRALFNDPNHWLDDRIIDEMPETDHYPDEMLNELFFYIRDGVYEEVGRSRSEIIRRAKSRMLRYADWISIRVTRHKIEIQDLHREYDF